MRYRTLLPAVVSLGVLGACTDRQTTPTAPTIQGTLAAASPGDEAPAQGFTFAKIDAPNAVFTAARAVNADGDIVGWFIEGASFKRHGYLLRNGTFAQIDFDNDPNRNTTALGLNDAGDIVGDYAGTDGRTHGYLLNGGSFTTVDPPTSVRTTARSINSHGDIAGFFRNATGFHGFLFQKSTNSFTVLDFPDALLTQATGINDNGEIVGLFLDSSSRVRGFVRTAGGMFIALNDVPGALDVRAWGINNFGRIAGFYDELGRALLSGLEPGGNPFPEPEAVLHGFLLDGGPVTRVNISGVAGGINTCIFWINDAGVIVGQYDGTTDGRTHGFVGFPAR